MSKKILKRSLALGALMAFVITGSAMAAVVLDGDKKITSINVMIHIINHGINLQKNGLLVVIL